MRALPLLPLILLAAPAIGQKHDSNAPINFDAGHIELQDKVHRAVLTGSVVVHQAEMTLTADRMTIAYTGDAGGGHPQASRVDAAGSVVVTRPDQTAHGSFGIYDVNRHVVTMLGAVTLTQGGNTVSGGRLTINLDSGHAVIDGSSVPGSGGAGGVPGAVQSRGGRVTGTFSVPKRDGQP